MFSSSVRCQRRAWLISPARFGPMPALFFPLLTILTKTTASNFSGTMATNSTIKSKHKSRTWFSAARSTISGRRLVKSDAPRASTTPLAATSNSRRRVSREKCRSKNYASPSMLRMAPLTNRRRAFCASSGPTSRSHTTSRTE